jgi:teichoic acid transport system ATP-binding protein
VFLVSHSEQSIRDTCERAIWLERGVLRADGPTAAVLKEYETYVNK